MRYLSKENYHRELEKIQRSNRQKQLKQKLKAEKSKYKKRVHIETSKFIAIYLFILLNAIVIYAMISMWKFADLSYLGVLISDIAAQILIYAIYCMKAYNGKKAEEEMKFKREKYAGTLDNILSAGTSCETEDGTMVDNIDTLVSQENQVSD